MSPHDFVYSSIYNGAIRKGATSKAAADHAEAGLNDYKQGNFTKPVHLIEERIKAACVQDKEKKVSNGK